MRTDNIMYDNSLIAQRLQSSRRQRTMIFSHIPTTRPSTPLLDTINAPADLKLLAPNQLEQLADELRHFLLYAVGQTGGHFAANLGVIELTIALHTVLNTPNDYLVWDVGHQAYAHKVLTGRRETLLSIRQKGGLAAFPDRKESPFDTFGAGHSSTSISATLGIALAQRLRGETYLSACVIGDGAMTAGMAFEAMNDAVFHGADMTVILNDNDMSISDSIGGFSKYLSAVWQNGMTISLTDTGEIIQLDRHSQQQFKSRKQAKHISDNLFKAIGFEYFGPLNGHDLPELIRMLRLIVKRPGPKLLHIYTTKGKGFTPAELDPIGYHAIAKYNPDGKLPHSKPKYSDIFGQFLCDQAALDTQLVAITPAMCEGSGMVQFAKTYPERFFDVAIAEQHALTLAAGMACAGLKPVVAIYSTFLQRGYDQLIHDIALQNLDVTFGIDRAGLVGEDGPTHAGAYDFAFMRTIPNLVIMAPKDENECRHMLHTAYHYPGPASVRYPRGTGPATVLDHSLLTLDIGKAELVCSLNVSATTRVAILAFGSMVSVCQQSAEQAANATNIGLDVYNMRFIKPLDFDLISQLASTHRGLITVEEHAIMGGAGAAVAEALSQLGQCIPLRMIGIPDRFIAHATHSQMLAECGLDLVSIGQHISQFIASLRLEAHPSFTVK